jgi:hypothetical protein
VETKRYQLASRLRLAVRIIGFGAVGFVLTFLIGETSIDFLAKGW